MQRAAQIVAMIVQACLVVVALVVVFFPTLRTPSIMSGAYGLALATIATVIWRMSRAGAIRLSMTELWARFRRDPGGANVGVNYFDILAVWMSMVVMFLAR